MKTTKKKILLVALMFGTLLSYANGNNTTSIKIDVTVNKGRVVGISQGIRGLQGADTLESAINADRAEAARIGAEAAETIAVSSKDIAVSNDFLSRNTQVKQKTITKTFSLFKEECLLINEAISQYNNLDDNFTAVSGSDIVRAALYSFSKLSDEERHNLITKHRGRGR